MNPGSSSSLVTIASARRSPRAFTRGLIGALGLDAALVLGVWTALLPMASGGSSGSVPSFAALAAALAYLGDHLLDARRLGAAPELCARHDFAQRHRRVLERVWILGAVGGVVLAATILSSVVWARGLVLALTAVAYLLACRLWPRLCRSWPPRELAVGIFFALGVAVLAPVRVGDLSVFAALCSLNALLVAVRDMAADRRQGEVSSATRWPSLARRVSSMIGLFFGATVLAAAGGFVSPSVVLAALLAAFGLLITERRGSPWFRAWTADLSLAGAAGVALLFVVADVL